MRITRNETGRLSFDIFKALHNDTPMASLALAGLMMSGTWALVGCKDLNDLLDQFPLSEKIPRDAYIWLCRFMVADGDQRAVLGPDKVARIEALLNDHPEDMRLSGITTRLCEILESKRKPDNGLEFKAA